MTTATQFTEEITSFLARQPLPGIIGGEHVAASSGATFVTRDPGTGEAIAEVCALQPDDVDQAVRAAAEAFERSGWAAMPVNERCALLHRLADAAERRRESIGQLEATDCGKVLAQAIGDVQNFVDTTRYFANMALHVRTSHDIGGRPA